jgi:hypothetical protein
LVEKDFKLRGGASEAGDDLSAPLYVGKAPTCGPIRRIVRNRPYIAEFVSELEDFGSVRLSRCVLDLEALSFFGRERFVVGYFRYKGSYIVAEAPRDLIPADVLIFDRIVEEPRDDEVRVLSACRFCNE